MVAVVAWVVAVMAAVAAADEHLTKLGALDESGEVTPIGRRMSPFFPVQPRQACMLIVVLPNSLRAFRTCRHDVLRTVFAFRT